MVRLCQILLFATIVNTFYVQAFLSVQLRGEKTSNGVLHMAGFGTKAPKKKKKKATSKQPSFDINASISRLEKRYDELMLASAKQMAKADEDPRWAASDSETKEDIITSEYMIAARASSKKGVNDWVPICQICIAYPESEYQPESKAILEAAVSSYCREISHVAIQGAQVFSTVARNDMEYGIEPVDSFFKYVYESVVEENSDKPKTMSKAVARQVLGLEDDPSLDKTQIKQAYRKLSFQLHPDRVDTETMDADEASERFEKVQQAFEILTSGIRETGKSWYESLGGRARTDFHKVNLVSLTEAQTKMEEKRIQGAVIGLERELVQSFVARHLRSG